ncbi:uncharacterized protein G2W53_005774 [Senna tora]|uniref:Uncharacterized protein n=1 Tax=Senna tora TaxID=362788 RepID=A0A834X2S0_9FABA|nr:uncharacterized protein G2W53_005774 [Senna tora]
MDEGLERALLWSNDEQVVTAAPCDLGAACLAYLKGKVWIGFKDTGSVIFAKIKQRKDEEKNTKEKSAR